MNYKIYSKVNIIGNQSKGFPRQANIDMETK